MEELDWKNSSTRDGFEKGLKTHKERKKDWSLCQNIRWLVEIVIFQFLCMATLTGKSMTSDAETNKKYLLRLHHPSTMEREYPSGERKISNR